MISQKTPTQAEVDSALLEKFGIKPTEKFTSDKSQQLYTNEHGKGFMLPASNQGYSWYFVEDILAHIQQSSTCDNVVGNHTFVAKPDLKLVEPT